MASLPGIVIKVTTDTVKAVQGLNRVNTAMGRTMTRGERVTSTFKKMGPAIAGAAVAAGAAAVAIGVDAVKATMDEEAEIAQLSKTLENLGFADATDSVNSFVDELQASANVADSDLRPALADLVRGTGDVAQAQDALITALDISASTGKDLSTVTAALSRGFRGNKTALSRLGVGLDKAYLATASMDEIMARLAETMGGASAARAGSVVGAVEGVSLAWDDLRERFGKGLLGDSETAATDLENVEGRIRDLGPAAETAGGSIKNLALNGSESVARLLRAGQQLSDGELLNAFQSIGEWVSQGWIPDNLFGDVTTGLDGTGDAASFAATQMQAYADSLNAAARALPRFRSAQGASWGPASERDWQTVDERLKGARLQQAWREMEAANDARRARQEKRRQAARDKRRKARLDAAAAARAARIADRKHAARTGTKPTTPKAGRRSC
jgi:hypothetical protein